MRFHTRLLTLTTGLSGILRAARALPAPRRDSLALEDVTTMSRKFSKPLVTGVGGSTLVARSVENGTSLPLSSLSRRAYIVTSNGDSATLSARAAAALTEATTPPGRAEGPTLLPQRSPPNESETPLVRRGLRHFFRHALHMAKAALQLPVAWVKNAGVALNQIGGALGGLVGGNVQATISTARGVIQAAKTG